MTVLYVDHYDSFAYNVVHLLASQGAQPAVMRSDDPRLDRSTLSRYDVLVVGPGPGHPRDLPRVLDVLRAAVEGGMPVFGVCLGLQAIGEVLGATVTHAPRVMHGKTSRIEHGGGGIFAGIPSPIVATRYHSLCLAPETLPESLLVTARSEDGVIQAVAHRERPVYGVQFHPESVLSEHGGRLIRNFLDAVT
ncbi:MAG TPA: aminodeoxychorismate/anthranilate synthase component II [Candidatus Tyrphobacter sp.]